MQIFNLIRTMAIMENIQMWEKEGFAINILFEGNAFPFDAFAPMNEMESTGQKSREKYEEPNEEELGKWQGTKEQ